MTSPMIASKGRVLLWSAAFVLLGAVPTLAADFFGRVISGLDGDTLEVMHNHHPERIRLSDIDCPEKGQAFGNNAKQAASTLAFGKDVTVIMDYTKLAGDMPKEQLEITGVVTVEYLVGRACASLAGAGRIFMIFSREQVGFLRFEWLQIGQNAL